MSDSKAPSRTTSRNASARADRNWGETGKFAFLSLEPQFYHLDNGDEVKKNHLPRLLEEIERDNTDELPLQTMTHHSNERGEHDYWRSRQGLGLRGGSSGVAKMWTQQLEMGSKGQPKTLH